MELYPSKPILIVDDEVSWLTTFELLLRRKSKINNFVLCHDSWKVVGLLQKQPFSLVLLDLSMPGCAGREILEIISERHPELPVVIITGHNSDDITKKCLEAGAKAVLAKTLDENEMIAALLEILEQAD